MKHNYSEVFCIEAKKAEYLEYMIRDKIEDYFDTHTFDMKYRTTVLNGEIIHSALILATKKELT